MDCKQTLADWLGQEERRHLTPEALADIDEVRH